MWLRVAKVFPPLLQFRELHRTRAFGAELFALGFYSKARCFRRAEATTRRICSEVISAGSASLNGFSHFVPSRFTTSRIF